MMVVVVVVCFFLVVSLSLSSVSIGDHEWSYLSSVIISDDVGNSISEHLKKNGRPSSTQKPQEGNFKNIYEEATFFSAGFVGS